jgi:hypothetical protein
MAMKINLQSQPALVRRRWSETTPLNTGIRTVFDEGII